MRAKDSSEVIETERLRLTPYKPEQIVALIENPVQFERLFGYPAAPGLREFYTSGDVSREFLDSLRVQGDADPWRFGFGVVDPASQCVIGAGGFKGAPSEGIAEIAYGIVPDYQRRGYATEVARALVSYALRDPSVTSVRAHTLPHNVASGGVLSKCGFVFCAEVDDPDDGRVWRWELPR